jgi:predicted regulator of Ras-like GTPase activity (Roadblock/LC7/MglB family)
VAIDDALQDLLDLSSQIREVVVLGSSGFVIACSTRPERGEQLARLATELLAAARAAGDERRVARVEVQHGAGGAFVVEEGGRTIVATTVPDATAALVVYDLRTALERATESEPAANA